MPKTDNIIRSTRVSVNHWQNRRSVQIYKDKVGLQVTVPSCSHCVTCQNRVRQFSETLRRKPSLIYKWRTLNDGASWVFIPRSQKQKPLDLLRSALEIEISES